MPDQIKKLIFSFTFNITLFLILMVAIQNSEERKKVLFFKYQSITLPISFIIGTSFISGSVLGSIIMELKKK